LNLLSWSAGVSLCPLEAEVSHYLHMWTVQS
jgi:hypothetical protein